MEWLIVIVVIVGVAWWGGQRGQALSDRAYNLDNWEEHFEPVPRESSSPTTSIFLR